MPNKNYEDRLIQIGLKIAYYRKLRGYTQLQLAEIVDMSVGHLAQIEASGLVQAMSLKTLFTLADALCVEPYKLLEFEP